MLLFVFNIFDAVVCIFRSLFSRNKRSPNVHRTKEQAQIPVVYYGRHCVQCGIQIAGYDASGTAKGVGRPLNSN